MYSFQELQQRYSGAFSDQQIFAYWCDECMLAPTEDGALGDRKACDHEQRKDQKGTESTGGSRIYNGSGSYYPPTGKVDHKQRGQQGGYGSGARTQKMDRHDEGR